MKERWGSKIAMAIIIGLMGAVLAGCGGGGGNPGSSGGGGTTELMGGSVQGTVLALSENVVDTLAGSLTGQSGSADNVVGTNARFLLPIGITTDGVGNLYIADSNNHTIRKVVIATGSVTTIAGKASTPDFVNDPNGRNARFDGPSGITSDGSNLYVADSNNHAIRRISLSGQNAVTTLAGTGFPGSQDSPGVVEFSGPRGITTDGTYLYVADSANSTIRRMFPDGSRVTTIAGSAGIQDFINSSNGLNARFDLPQGITTDGTNLYVADSNNYAIRRIVLSGLFAVSTLAGSGLLGFQDGQGTGAEFNFPLGVTSDGTNLYVSDTDNKTIRKITGTGVVTTIAGDAQDLAGYVNTAPPLARTDARFDGPSGITTDGVQLFVSDSNNNAIRSIK